MAFVDVNKSKKDVDEADVDIEAMERKARALLTGLAPAELDDLHDRFCSEQEVLPNGMWDLRDTAIAREVAIERSLVPDEAEMNNIIRTSSHLTRLEERKVDCSNASRKPGAGRRVVVRSSFFARRTHRYLGRRADRHFAGR